MPLKVVFSLLALRTFLEPDRQLTFKMDSDVCEFYWLIANNTVLLQFIFALLTTAQSAKERHEVCIF
jgi:hypothetical protein